eukprot:3966054-Pyramimonas_sp.AAC.1
MALLIEGTVPVLECHILGYHHCSITAAVVYYDYRNVTSTAVAVQCYNTTTVLPGYGTSMISTAMLGYSYYNDRAIAVLLRRCCNTTAELLECGSRRPLLLLQCCSIAITTVSTRARRLQYGLLKEQSGNTVKYHYTRVATLLHETFAATATTTTTTTATTSSSTTTTITSTVTATITIATTTTTAATTTTTTATTTIATNITTTTTATISGTT